MLSKTIIKSFVILSAFVASVYTIKGKCLDFKDPEFCTEYVPISKKKKAFVTPFFFTEIYKSGIKSVKEFNQNMQKFNYNPVYPADVKIFNDDFGCNYDNSNKVRYVISYQCNFIFNQKGKNCTEDYKDELPKLCTSSCDTYFKDISDIFSNEAYCNQTATVEQNEKRQKKLEEIKNHCLTFTDSSEDCLMGSGNDYDYCGFKYESEFIDYCNKNLNEACCSIERKNSNNVILNIVMYTFIGLIILLIIVLMALKIYSVQKNKKDEISRSRIQEIEKRREVERDKYREQLSKEVSSDSINIPLLQRNPSSPAYQNQRTPVLSPNTARPVNNPPFPQRNGTQPGSSPFPPRGVTKPENEKPFVQRNGSLPPQHSGSQDSYGLPPQHSGSQDSFGLSQHNNSRDNLRRNPSFPQQNRPYPGPAQAPRPPPPANTVNSPRDSPRYGASRPPAQGGLPRSGSGHFPPNRPPPGGNRQYPPNNNRY